MILSEQSYIGKQLAGNQLKYKEISEDLDYDNNTVTMCIW